MQRSGEITPRRAAWARSKREVWVGKRSVTWRAISAPGGGHADEDGAGPGADAAAGLLAEGGVGLVADHDRVGVGDLARVADEPLVGLDGDRAVGMVGVAEQRRREPVAVAAVGDLADELVDEVAAVGEDQDAAGARGLDEADGGDRLAGAGRVLEPEAAAGAGVLGGLLDDVLVLLGLRPSPWAPRRARARRRPRRPRSVGLAVPARRRCRRLGRVGAVAGLRLAVRSCRSSLDSAISAASVPESASTWCGSSSAPSARCGVLLGEHPLEAEQQRVVCAATRSRAPRGPRRSRPGRRRARGGAASPGSRSFGFSPSSRKGSRANSCARSISALGWRLRRFRGHLSGFSHEAF